MASATSGICPLGESRISYRKVRIDRPGDCRRRLPRPRPLLAAQIWHRRLLDDEGRLWDVNLECGVVEVARRTALDPRHQCLVRATVEPDEVPAGAER